MTKLGRNFHEINSAKLPTTLKTSGTAAAVTPLGCHREFEGGSEGADSLLSLIPTIASTILVVSLEGATTLSSVETAKFDG